MTAFAPAGSPAKDLPPRFKVQSLPTLPGGESSAANDISDTGQIAGTSTTPGTSYPNAVTWIDGQVINITGAGVSGASANAVNNKGVVVGISDSLGLNAFSWKDGVLTPLPFPHACCSIATSLNDAGAIAGLASLEGVNTPNDGVLWQEAQLVPLGTLGGTLAHAQDINSSGTIVGMSDIKNNGAYFPFIWNDGAMVPLPTLGGAYNGANAVSDSGIIVGFSTPSTFGNRAVKWVDGQVIPLPLLGVPLSEASDVNESGWIVGHAWTSLPGSTTAALWIDEQVHDLSKQSLLEASDHLYDARGVNESGQIVGEGVFDGHFHGYVITPLSPGDVNGDDSVNVDDLLAVINGWGACVSPHSVATCPADLNSTGSVDVDDLLLVINDWE